MAEQQWNPETGMPSLQGKVAVVTGGSASGLGLHIVKYLASKGAKVYFTTRSQKTGDRTLEELGKLLPDLEKDQVKWIQLDLTDLDSIARAVQRLRTDETRIDLLVNNAGGVAHGGYQTTSEGWEMNMATNYIGHFIFTNGILSLLKTAAAEPGSDVRIIMTSSNTPIIILSPSYTFRFDKVETLTGTEISYPLKWRLVFGNMFRVDMVRYAVAKAAVSVFARELQRRLDAEGVPINCLSVDPGGSLTEEVLELFYPYIRPIAKGGMGTVEQGSHSLLWGAAAAEVPDANKGSVRGGYFEPVGKPRLVHPVVDDKDQAKSLWEVTAAEAKKHLDKKGLSSVIGEF